MDDTEAVDCKAFDAKAVLLALGGQIVWHTHPDGVMNGFINDEFRYYICPDHDPYSKCNSFIVKMKWYSQGMLALGDGYPEYCSSLCAAISACERHHATGEWE